MFWTSEIVTGVKSSNKVPSCGLSQEKLSPVVFLILIRDFFYLCLTFCYITFDEISRISFATFSESSECVSCKI